MMKYFWKMTHEWHRTDGGGKTVRTSACHRTLVEHIEHFSLWYAASPFKSSEEHKGKCWTPLWFSQRSLNLSIGCLCLRDCNSDGGGGGGYNLTPARFYLARQVISWSSGSMSETWNQTIMGHPASCVLNIKIIVVISAGGRIWPVDHPAFQQKRSCQRSWQEPSCSPQHWFIYDKEKQARVRCLLILSE